MSSLPHSIFNTDNLPERERFSGWREDMSVIFDVEQIQCSPEDDGLFYADFDLYHFGHSVLGGLASSSGRYVRSQRKATRDGLDGVLIQLFLEGSVQFGVGQRTTYAEAGDIIVFDLAQPVDNINRNFRHITLMWPRPTIEKLIPNIGSWHGLTLPKESPSTALLRQHLISSYDLAPRFTTQEARRVEDATLALVGAAMSDVSLSEETLKTPAMKELLAYQIKRYIRKNLGLSNLAPEQIARHFGISRRQLYHLLEPLGGISKYQLNLRLQRCLSDIQNPEHVKRSLSEIAYSWGFKHPATFNRNFRAAFGITPGEAREKALAQEEKSSLEVLSTVACNKSYASREHHQWFHAIGI